MALRPAGETVRLIDKPPGLDTIGIAPIRLDGNLVAVIFDGAEQVNLITISGIKKQPFRLLFGCTTETFT